MFKRLFSFLDLTPQKLPFFKLENSTNLGITLSLFTYLMIMIFITSNDLFYKRNPKIIKTILHDNSNAIGIENGDLLCMNIFDDNSNYFSDPQAFSIEISYAMLNPNTKKKESRFIKKLNASQRKDQIDFCFQYDKEEIFDIDNPTFLNKELTISLILCNTSEISNNCKSSEKIREFFSEVKYIKTTFTKKVFDPSDYSSPFKDHIYTSTQKIHLGTYIKQFHYFRSVEVFNDERILLYPYYKKLNAIAFDHSEKDFALIQEPSLNLIDVSFLSSGKVYSYKRSYENISELFAGVVGLLHIGIFICYLFNIVPRKFKFMKSIIRTKFAIDYYRNLDKAEGILKFRSPPIQLRPKRKKISGGLNPKLGGGLSSIAFQQSEYLFNDSKLKSYLLFSVSDRKSDKNKQLSKDLKSDSFILDHYSLEGATDKEGPNSSSPSPNRNINSLDFSGKEKDKDIFYIKTAKLEKQLNFADDDKLAYNNKASIFVNSLSKLFALTHSKPMFKFGNYLKYKVFHFFQGRKKNKENLLFMKAEKICNKELDVKRMISKLHEIDLLKYLLFDSDQLALIDVLKKKAYDPELIDFPRNKNTSQTKENLIKCYDRVFVTSKTNDTNLRLIKLCEDL